MNTRRNLFAVSLLCLAALATPAAEPSQAVFDRTMTRLDSSGEMMVFINTDGVCRKLITAVQDLIQIGQAQNPNATPGGAENIKRFDQVLAVAGLHDIQAFGLTSRQRADGLHDIKYFVARDPAARGRIWDIMGREPSELRSLKLMSSDDVLDLSGSVHPQAVWDLVRDAIREIGGDEALAKFDKGQEAFTRESKIDIAATLKGLGNEQFLFVNLSSKDTIALPVPGAAKMEIPEPAVVAGFACNDPALASRIREGLFGEGSTIKEEKAGDVTIRYGAPIQGMPVPLQPAIAEVDGLVVVATTPKALRAALEARAGNGRLADTAEFKKYATPVPAKCNAFGYVSPRLMETVLKFVNEAGADKQGPTETKMLALVREMIGPSAGLTIETAVPDGYLGYSVSPVGARRAMISSTVPFLAAVMTLGVRSRADFGGMPQVVEVNSAAEFDPDSMLAAVAAAKARFAADRPDNKTPTMADLKPYLPGEQDIALPDGAAISVNPIGTPAILRMPDGTIHRGK